MIKNMMNGSGSDDRKQHDPSIKNNGKEKGSPKRDTDLGPNLTENL
jgi:hypothetical protein